MPGYFVQDDDVEEDVNAWKSVEENTWRELQTQPAEVQRRAWDRNERVKQRRVLSSETDDVEGILAEQQVGKKWE